MKQKMKLWTILCPNSAPKPGQLLSPWQVKEFQDNGQPVISVDAKKKENIGQYKNNGYRVRLWKRENQFLVHELGI
jgi:hypothetical protein